MKFCVIVATSPLFEIFLLSFLQQSLHYRFFRMANILEALINASERAACIARSCCTGGETLLVAEKHEGEANARFERDFKTIADVLAQESAKAEIAQRCPELAKHVRGEECAEINGVSIGVQESVDKTTELLCLLVPSVAAIRMAKAAHGDIKLDVLNNLPFDLPMFDAADLGVWIDPIDATAEFIAGIRGEAEAERGLSCVTVLIGAYLISTGEPIVGVINQPFFNNGKGRIVWGVSYGDIRMWNGNNIETHSNANIVLMSGAEKPVIKEKFEMAKWKVISLPGAGHKLLKVALGEAAAYIVSKGTTFRWDTCAPHAILRAKGGNLLNYNTRSPITYNDPYDVDTQQYCNSDGLIAYSDPHVYNEIKDILK